MLETIVRQDLQDLLDGDQEGGQNEALNRMEQFSHFVESASLKILSCKFC